eukprot:3424439-Pyramimonas_sp.AAC.1
MAGSSGNGVADDNELYEADEQAARALGVCDYWGADGCPSQEGQTRPGRGAAAAAGGAALGLLCAEELQGSALGCGLHGLP